MTTHEPIPSPAGQVDSIKIDNLLINFTTEFLRVWDTAGLRTKPAAFWHPTPAPDLLPGYFPLGDVAAVGHGNINGKRVVVVAREADTPSADPSKGKALRRPDDFELIWKDAGSRSKRDLSIWRPIPPEGYVALGSVCSNDHEKPSFNAVRCVRADLVIASATSEPAWNDKGSGARQSISAWHAVPPTAATGEIHLAPGTFVGFSGYTKPENFLVYSLRMQIPITVNPKPAAPLLCGEVPTQPEAPDQPTYIARLPWFTIKDPLLSPLEQLSGSPFYLLERTDQYLLVGHAHNTENESRTFRWVAPRAQRAGSLRSFTHNTSVEFGAQWQTNLPNPFLFSARLNHDFTQCEIHSNEWLNAVAIDVVAVVDKQKSVAIYLIQSDYRLLRTDGTPVTSGFSYTDGNSLHISQYVPEKPEVIVVPEQEPEAEMTIDTQATNDEPAAPLPEPELPTATDTAP
ncbi:Vps62-related protein [Pseudomonas sp. NPDC087615]|uniref:Vps62-related protein n=1 Tax=Pseudomonas sp. NPDC087615 TaxID=3364443 RepID=UPI0038237D76